MPALERAPLSHDSEEAESCLREAVMKGFTSGVQATVVSGSLYFLAMNYSQFFRTGFTASARTALTVMPIFYTAWLNAENAMHSCMKSHAPEYVVIHDD